MALETNWSGHYPEIAPTAYVHPIAALIGRVRIGDHVSGRPAPRTPLCSRSRSLRSPTTRGTLSSTVHADLRQRMGGAAVLAAKAVNYVNAGTVEFILSETGKFYFMEMNTRIQVEHPVREMVTGVDLVELQLRIAAGERLPFPQKDIRFSGHAMECRFNTEDPAKSFRPCPGTISTFVPPSANGWRLDTHLYVGYTVRVFYDSLLAKLIVHEKSREEAIASMLRALGECVIEGVSTTIPFHKRLLEDAAFRGGRVHTKYVEWEFLARGSD